MFVNVAGVNILFSGAAGEFNVSNEAYGVLIPALVEALTTVQTPYPYPPDPEVYEGVYTTEIPGQPNFTITTYQNQLLMKSPLNTFLAYREPLNLQVSLYYLRGLLDQSTSNAGLYCFLNKIQAAYPDNLQPCLLQELLALQGQWLYFVPPVSGKSPSFTLPGILNNVILKRIQ